MAEARIYLPAKSAMQSGRAGTREWVLEFVPAEAKRHDPLMGWISSGDTRLQLRLTFATLAEAEAHAQRLGLAYKIQPAHQRTIKPKAYADNFKYDRVRG
ncbi:ETC complex I subunit-like protein [Stella humosa]|uniref:ETC complex I subunit-like protein n=1 Tax=Stella humosa TaxID=94 RepID=A0A3N1MCE3_9PROT|nr:ETC complex I subunit [Stella humosa]ROQ00420.1 ETC complex I subunit-like protein [Stella humosa]